MQQVLSTTTSASSIDVVADMPSASNRPAIRSESCSFIWHPKVRIKYFLLTSDRLGEAQAASSFGRMASVDGEADGQVVRRPHDVEIDVGGLGCRLVVVEPDAGFDADA